jgi:hypothetical protein
MTKSSSRVLSKQYFPTGGIVCCENTGIAYERNGLLILHFFKMESAFDVDDLVLDILIVLMFNSLILCIFN